jgi:signal transduction histidine kinase
MTVRDTGAGVPPHLLPRVFEPFFTTKEHRQGLSLSRAKRYVELHGGILQLLSSGKDGTIFQMELPLQGASLVKLLNRSGENK